MKIYKHYFLKSHTPYKETYQAKKKYHTAWKHQPYTMILHFNVYQIKLFGIFAIYKNKELKEYENNS